MPGRDADAGLGLHPARLREARRADQVQRASHAASATSPNQCAPAALQVAPVNGRTIINANINYRYDTPQANHTVVAIRKVVHAIPGADALVGGQTAITYDTQQASAHDRNLIIPIVLLVILIVLGLVLRALLAPCC